MKLLWSTKKFQLNMKHFLLTKTLLLLSESMKQCQLQVPTVAVTFSSEPDLSTMSDGFPAGEDVTMPEIPEIISDQFQFQTSFRAHFVRDFDYVSESVSAAVNGQAEQSQEVTKDEPSDNGV